MIAAGTLNQRIQITPTATTQNRAGETNVGAFGMSSLVWASVRAQSNAEQIRNGLSGSDYTYAIRIRYRSGVTDSARITYRGRQLDVYSVIEGGQNNREWLDIVAIERVA